MRLPKLGNIKISRKLGFSFEKTETVTVRRRGISISYDDIPQFEEDIESQVLPAKTDALPEGVKSNEETEQ